MLKVKTVQTPLEKEQAFDVRKRVFTEEQGVSPDIEFDASDASAIHFIGYAQQRPAAAGRLRIIEKGTGKAERICVLPEYRGQGIGIKMMKEVENVARNSGLNILRLNAQVHALRFYEYLGYDTVSQEFLSAGIPHKTMEKVLT